MTWTGLNEFTFLNVDFKGTAPIFIDAGDAWHAMALNMVNCQFENMPGGTFSSEPASALLHIENMAFDSVSAVPTFLETAVVNGTIVQWSGSNTPGSITPTVGSNGLPIWYEGNWIGGGDTELNQTVSNAWRPVTYARPSDACVNIKDLGAKGDGSTDDTAVIRRFRGGW